MRPDALHIATEGPLGFAARGLARRAGYGITTSLHTRLPEYIHAWTGFPEGPIYAWMKRFHDAGSRTMVATASLRAELSARGFKSIKARSRGVDLTLFQPQPREDWSLPRPVLLYVGRAAVEKNLADFLNLTLPGSKIVVGDGPLPSSLRRDCPSVLFTGPRHSHALARAYAGAATFLSHLVPMHWPHQAPNA